MTDTHSNPFLVSEFADSAQDVIFLERKRSRSYDDKQKNRRLCASSERSKESGLQ